MTVKLSPVFNDEQLDNNGLPANLYQLATFAAGSTTPVPTFTDNTGGAAQQNPITLNSRGEPPFPIWLTAGQAYKFVLMTPGGAVIRTIDNVTGVNDSSVSTSQWQPGPIATYVSPNSFTLNGDQTTVFKPKRRVQLVDAGGTKTGVIATSVYDGVSLTTITVTLDAGILVSPIASLTFSLLSPDSNALPQIFAAGSGVTITYPGGIPTFSTGVAAQVAQGRITLVSGSPVVAAPNTTGANTVYFSPYNGNQIELYDPVALSWGLTTFSEVSQLTTDATKSPTAVGNNLNYDMFAWNDAGTFRCTHGPSWVAGAGAGSAVARGTGAGSTELEFFQGRYVNKNAIANGPAARAGLYVGSIQSNGTATIDDTATVMGVWNLYNPVERYLRNTFTADRTRAASTYAEMNAEIQIKTLTGLSIAPVKAWTNGSYQNAAAAFKSAAIAFDSTTTAEPGFEVADANSSTAGSNTLAISNSKTGLLGSHFITILGGINAGTLTMATASVLGTSAKVYLNASTPA